MRWQWNRQSENTIIHVSIYVAEYLHKQRQNLSLFLLFSSLSLPFSTHQNFPF
ncbi:hypothetical protein Pint_27029 [Pistacia integerrima]|uniref:Uncharacterized protein n=1 Tax=Pistacia integerrima TaxID=434235 RepID=A0ACC0YQQ1_9ROSI|nr:hypothetical protein Pint_27029 [Pistacia integerrima]